MRKAWRPSHEPGRRHRPQGTPLVFRFTGRLRGCFRLSPPDRPALVPGHRDRQQPQHAAAARAGEPAGAEPQRIRLPARVLQHGRHPAPGRADPDHAPVRRGEEAQDHGAARDFSGHDHRHRRGEVHGGPDGLRRHVGAERRRPGRPGPLRRVPLAPHPYRVLGHPPHRRAVPERRPAGVEPDGEPDHRRDSEFRGPASVLALRLGRTGVRRHRPRQGPVLPLPARSLRPACQGTGGNEGPGLFRRRHRLHPVPDAPGDRIAAMAVMSNRLTFLLGVLGGVLAGAGVVIYALTPERTALIAAVEGLAAACLTVFLVRHFELFREFSTRRATRLGLNSILMIVLMGTILGILNFLAARHSVRWDFSETKRFTLAPQTARLLRELPREVKVTVFTSDQSPVRLAYRDLIDSYQTRTAKLTVEFVDPEKKPGLARQYGITRPDTAVLESGKQETRITSASEQELTNALIRVTKDEKKTVYFLTGHAEHLLEDGSKEGYSFLKEALERQGYTVRSLSLYESKTIPTKASVLVLAGPQKPVSPAEQVRLADYVRTGGRLLLLLDPGSRAGLESTLAAWGLRTDNRTVLDTQTILGGDLTMPVVNTYGTHEITQDLGQVFTMFPHARPVSFLDGKSNEWVFHPLAKSSPRSWATPETPPDRATQPRDFNPRKDTQGPLTLAALVVARADASENARQPAVLLVGDSDFASNAFLDFSGNTDFILHAVAWLAEEKDLVTIAPKDTTLGTLLLTAAQSNALFVLQVLGLPGFFLLAGFAVWRHRRRL